MRVFHCSICDKHFRQAYATVLVPSVMVEVSGDEYLIVDEGFYDIVYVKKAGEFRCPEDHVVELVEIEKEQCQHDWNVSGHKRMCVLCGARQTGKISFDE